MSVTLANKRIILYAEDDPDDFQVLTDAMTQADPALHIIRAQNGQEAIQYLKSVNNTAALPCLIILDINMPMIDGRQAIRLIKEEPHLKHIPIVAFTTSTNPMDKLLCQKLNVDCFSKPNNNAEIEASALRILAYCKQKQ